MDYCKLIRFVFITLLKKRQYKLNERPREKLNFLTQKSAFTNLFRNVALAG